MDLGKNQGVIGILFSSPPGAMPAPAPHAGGLGVFSAPRL